jgi:NAD/NADP transhydrogenase alpha subunit
MPSSDAVDPKQAAFNALKSVLNTAAAAMNNQDNTQEARDVAHALWSATNDQLDALDLAVFTGNTVQLQAAADEMTPSMTQLKALKAKIEALGDALKEGAAILSGIDKIAGEFGALGL